MTGGSARNHACWASCREMEPCAASVTIASACATAAEHCCSRRAVTSNASADHAAGDAATGIAGRLRDVIVALLVHDHRLAHQVIRPAIAQCGALDGCGDRGAAVLV